MRERFATMALLLHSRREDDIFLGERGGKEILAVYYNKPAPDKSRSRKPKEM